MIAEPELGVYLSRGGRNIPEGPFGDRIVMVVEDQDGTVLDVVKQKKPL